MWTEWKMFSLFLNLGISHLITMIYKLSLNGRFSWDKAFKDYYTVRPVTVWLPRAHFHRKMEQNNSRYYLYNQNALPSPLRKPVTYACLYKKLPCENVCYEQGQELLDATAAMPWAEWLVAEGCFGTGSFTLSKGYVLPAYKLMWEHKAALLGKLCSVDEAWGNEALWFQGHFSHWQS